MGRLNDHIKTLVESLVAFQGDHLGARDHDVANALVRNIHHPFKHIAGILVDKLVLSGVADQGQQLFAVFRLGVKKLAQ